MMPELKFALIVVVDVIVGGHSRFAVHPVAGKLSVHICSFDVITTVLLQAACLVS